MSEGRHRLLRLVSLVLALVLLGLAGARMLWLSSPTDAPPEPRHEAAPPGPLPPPLERPAVQGAALPAPKGPEETPAEAPQSPEVPLQPTAPDPAEIPERARGVPFRPPEEPLAEEEEAVPMEEGPEPEPEPEPEAQDSPEPDAPPLDPPRLRDFFEP